MRLDIRTIADEFNARARTYARSDWHRQCAGRLVELCRLRPGARVLDAGTGTGFAAIAAARRVGEEGRVLGVDVSSGMLREAAATANASGLSNIELLEADAVRLPDHAAGTFDVVTCAAGLLYMPVGEALREWRRLLRPGGLVAFSTMRAGSPLAGRMFRECVAAYGVALQDPSESLGTAAACRSALGDAGFDGIEIVGEAVELSAQDLSVAWESNFRSPPHAGVRALAASDLAVLKKAYEDALARAERESPGILTRAELLYAFGRC
jgi:ubiquinone/menaquinone biosynthesis C-methylase UbiE